MDDGLRPVPTHELRFDIEHALREAANLWPRRHVHGEYNPHRPMANAVVKHLELCGIRCFRKPPILGHSTPMSPFGPPHRDEDSETSGA